MLLVNFKQIRTFLFCLLLGASVVSCSDVQFADAPVEKGGPGDPVTPVVDECASKQWITQRETLTFNADSRSCDWSTNGNLSPIDGWIRARREQTQNITLPDNAVLCDVNIDFNIAANTNDFFYDDFLIFALDDVVLSNPQPLESQWSLNEIELPVYNWYKIQGMKIDWSAMRNNTCLGQSQGLSYCNIPAHDGSIAKGDLRMRFDSEIIQAIMAQDINQRTHTFKLIVTGDDNNAGSLYQQHDCHHSGISFEVEAKYVIKGE